MFIHNKRLQYTVRVGETNPALGSLLLEQFGGPDGELAAAMRYFTQALAEDDPGRKDMLLDIATEDIDVLSCGAAVNTDYILGIGKAVSKVTVLLDIDKVLSTNEVVELRATAVAE